jgi:hypothetical protein
MAYVTSFDDSRRSGGRKGLVLFIVLLFLLLGLYITGSIFASKTNGHSLFQSFISPGQTYSTLTLRFLGGESDLTGNPSAAGTPVKLGSKLTTTHPGYLADPPSVPDAPVADNHAVLAEHPRTVSWTGAQTTKLGDEDWSCVPVQLPGAANALHGLTTYDPAQVVLVYDPAAGHPASTICQRVNPDLPEAAPHVIVWTTLVADAPATPTNSPKPKPSKTPNKP